MKRAGGGVERRLRVLFLSWRDPWHPEAGGAEHTLSQVVRGLAARGHDVEVITARYDGRPSHEVVDGVRYRRVGTRLTVFPLALLGALRIRTDVIVDIQNGIPFGTALLPFRTVVLLVHHVHREEWRVSLGPVAGRVGWFIESRVSPRLHRRVPLVTVSRATAEELTDLGYRPAHISVVCNGVDLPAALPHRSPTPRIVVVSRLVPHKRIEQVIEAAAALLPRHPDLLLRIVGDGYHAGPLRGLTEQLGLDGHVEFLGRVTDEDRDREFARAWVNVLPSAKEGWGLVTLEAAACGTPSLAYRSAGGLRESIVDGVTGRLVDSFDDLVESMDALLSDRARVEDMGLDCRMHAAAHSWKVTVDGVEAALFDAAGASAR